MLFSKFVDKLCSGMCVAALADADADADADDDDDNDDVVVAVAIDGPLGGLRRCCCCRDCCCCCCCCWWLGETPPPAPPPAPRYDDDEGVALRDLANELTVSSPLWLLLLLPGLSRSLLTLWPRLG